MIFERWSARSRVLPAREVEGYFAEVSDRVLLFAFETDRMAVEPHSGHFSVKLVDRGEERYDIGSRRVALEAGRVLLLNAGERYGSSVRRPGTRSASFFLPPSEVSAVVAALRGSADSHLGSPLAEAATPEVPQAPFRPCGPLAEAGAGLLAAAFSGFRPSSIVDLEERVRWVALLAVRESLRLAPAGALGACTRRTTRDDLITRVVRAREFIDDCGGRATLDEAAAVACLSKYHFLRVFTEVIGRTPAQYARIRRTERGWARWCGGECAKRAARAGGFASTSSFFRALRRLATREPGGAIARRLAQEKQTRQGVSE